MPELVDMKLDKSEMEESCCTEQEYPYGLCIELCSDGLEKLGMQIPEVGKQFLLMANVEVKSTNSYKEPDGDVESRVSLQITAMNLMPSQEKRDPAKALYGE